MIIRNVNVVVNIGGQNKKSYSEILGRELKSGDTIKIEQTQLTKTSRSLVWCECDICHQPFTRKMNDILQKSRTIDSLTMCGNECKKEYMRQNNPNPPKDKIEVNCVICHNTVFVNEAKSKSQNTFCCSRKCYKEHRSKNYSGEVIYNYNSEIIKCEWCGQDGKTSQWRIDQEKGKFCSLRCYHYFCKKEYGKIIHTNLNYLNGGKSKPTKPEVEVANYLKNNSIIFNTEVTINNLYRADFYLPDYDSYIEVLGDYWHVNPDVYGEDESKFTSFQLNSVRVDRLRLKYLKDFGYDVHLVWEKDIYKNVEDCIGNILTILNNKQESSKTNTPNS